MKATGISPTHSVEMTLIWAETWYRELIFDVKCQFRRDDLIAFAYIFAG